ncbi:helix-turn-helix domain-containing protein [Streptomyces sp. RKAG293]|uniref:helix-turn-helix domain-containing protein n=1 Tax=Streptomyces sp. RKAG293 TaxID=2893403 RepID=UPI0035A890A2
MPDMTPPTDQTSTARVPLPEQSTPGQGTAVPQVRAGSLRLTGAARDAAQTQFKAMYDAGASIREIAERTHRSYGGVHHALVQAGVDFRNRGGRRRRKAAE